MLRFAIELESMLCGFERQPILLREKVCGRSRWRHILPIKSTKTEQIGSSRSSRGTPGMGAGANSIVAVGILVEIKRAGHRLRYNIDADRILRKDGARNASK